MNKIDPSEIRNGDILIYENQDFSFEKFRSFLPSLKDWNNPEKWDKAGFYVLLYVIAWCDPGKDEVNYKNIYHAAIWGSLRINEEEKTGVVGAGRSGIGVGGLGLTADTVKNIYVYRSNQEGFSGAKTNASLQAFYDDKDIEYAYHVAWLLSILCSLRYKDGSLHDLIEKQVGSKQIANLIVLCVQMMINDYMSRHQKDMVVCSTLVSMAYTNAGFPLRIHPLESGKGTPKRTPENEIDTIRQLEGMTLPLMVNDFPDIVIPETLITPRQLFESPDVYEVGYLPHKDS